MGGEIVEPVVEVAAPKKKGGARPGAGRKRGWRREQDDFLKGLLPAEAMTKEVAREFTRQTIIAGLAPMLRAQLAHAQGIGHCYTRDKNGKFTRVENLDQIDKLLTEGTENEHYFIFAKDPSAVAFKELLDRALDRPKEQAQEIHVTGEIELSARLTAARQRIIDVPISEGKPHLLPGGSREE